MRKLIFVCLALISASCADNGNKKITEKDPVNVGVLTVSQMSSEYYNVYVGEINASA